MLTRRMVVFTLQMVGFVLVCYVGLTLGEVRVISHFPTSLIVFVVFLGEVLEHFFLNK